MKSYYRVFIQTPDFLLLVFCCLVPSIVGIAINLASAFSTSGVAMLHVEEMCCESSAEPAIRKLLEVPGIKGATPNIKDKLIRLELTEAKLPAPRLIWEAAEATSLKPTTLHISGKQFRQCPVN